MNLPNKLSFIRMLFVPLVVVVYFIDFASFGWTVDSIHIGHCEIPANLWICMILFVFASITDFLDGYIARKYNLITSFGKFIDPIADKLLVNTSFLLLAFSQEIPFIPVLIMLWRDTMVDAIRMMASSKGEIMAAKYLGKLKTVIQMLAIILGFMQGFGVVIFAIELDVIFVYLAMLISCISGISYFIQAKHIVLESM